MRAIFYDLETSDKEPLGQILNYSFLVTDAKYEVVSELSGDIRISRLQLPSPEAILANRVDVLKQQMLAKDNEVEALKKIWQFLVNCSSNRAKPLALVGYNSARFDLPYLRTSMIRNGLNPYAWKNGIVDRDLILLVRKLACSCPDFPRLANSRVEIGEKPKLSLRLETLAQHFGLLHGKQSHNSKDDVLLTIRLAALLKQKYEADVLTYNPYEAVSLEAQQRQAVVTWAVEPNYDLELDQAYIASPFTLLCSNQNYALWVNLDAYKRGQGRQSIYCIKKYGGAFYLSPNQESNSEVLALAENAQQEFRAVNLSNYFENTICDIEQFIYRLDFSSRQALEKAIWEDDATALVSSKDTAAKILYLRFKLANYAWQKSGDSQMDQEMQEHLAQYALRRYGGKVVLSKTVKEGEPCLMHPSFSELVTKIITQLNSSSNTAVDKELLLSLKNFYFQSDIFKVAGKRLLSCQEVAQISN